MTNQMTRTWTTAAGTIACAVVLAGCAGGTDPASSAGSGGSGYAAPRAETYRGTSYRGPDRYAQIGTVSRIDPVPAERQTTGAGAVIGGVLGAVVGNQFGGGNGKTAATVAGAVGGAVVGNSIEKNRTQPAVAAYNVHVRLDNGDARVITVPDLGGLSVGERVRVEGTNLIRLG
jgi:outer membrane lipoprotein SlyB